MSKIETMNPATEEAINSYPKMSQEQAFDAVEACHAAFLEWRKKSHEERAPYLRAIADKLRENKDELAELMTREMGKLLKDGKTEVELCAQIFEYSADHGGDMLGDEERVHGDGKRGVVTYQPIGVIYSIQPWNFPLYQPVRVLAANLIAGNGCILKHASICTGSGLRLRELCIEAGLPEDLFQVVLIGHDVSDKLIEHKLVRGVTMTGSDGAGRHIGATAAKALKKTVLELGSNDAYLVLEDADIETAVKFSVIGRLYNNGETCVSAKRFVVADKVYDAFVEAFVAKMSEIQMGDPMEEGTKLGPLSSIEQFETVRDQVKESVANGAKVLCGGEVPDRTGAYYPATVLGDVKPGMPAYDDEIFGPVASVIRAKDDEDAMRIANDSRYGLGGGIFCKDEEHALKLAREHFDTGMVRINSFGAADPNMPFGGVKDSGYGREHGGFGMKEFVNAKAVYLPS
ncbi:NAD-dependent succinate-semialdehyde dehydrogenase [Sulfitobacter geojensis]|uniref:NAD-dependent succinate-semialdehyde dehydrogenase n=1 Tax=Sulfitobacter geojensis TaxID=1342299 RepID=A0AAE3B6V5_9RHOB|nr:NAD-dependent succinate-semialdehyde dehydrogenase [Sulfitobacter geojensis]MBM1690093.1 NAD-dependent succinate-semialdehyde dehydrogenase [Sulfitobacter geojensis]MBM1694159.1 NAD-dependent succinate-semialdehyde dehydrogenase [Sulfitobacter geojensis]MBM1706325.1 NAD-dependent succinate-semialdehyde dehydrogenase [Sulfitobacter geojensis]MBM1710383.1 NAD-dependent succinate-semialdehyde dehydrogenase [Sulfitobacter geojensis]MBM1714449.1 NAD-dependent succinate-semialdehyde dehydrogenase